MHGGTNPGAPKGEANGAYRHGLFTNEVVVARRVFRALMRASRKTVEMAKEMR